MAIYWILILVRIIFLSVTNKSNTNLDDFRIFVGDLGHEVTDEMLRNAFSAYPSLQKVRVIRRPGARKNRGYGFVCFKNPNDYLKAIKEMNGNNTHACLV